MGRLRALIYLFGLLILPVVHSQMERVTRQDKEVGTLLNGSIFQFTRLRSFISSTSESIFSSFQLPNVSVAGVQSPAHFFESICTTCGFQTPSEEYCADLSLSHMKKVYFHVVFDFKRPSAFPLLVNQICRALSLCIDKSQFRIVLYLSESTLHELSPKMVIEPVKNMGLNVSVPLSNYVESYNVIDFLHSLETGHISMADKVREQRRPPSLGLLELQQYHLSCALLQWLGIPFKTWLGLFDTLNLQQIRLRSLSDVTSPSQVIFQVDADEFPILPSNLSGWINKLTGEDRLDLSVKNQGRKLAAQTLRGGDNEIESSNIRRKDKVNKKMKKKAKKNEQRESEQRVAIDATKVKSSTCDVIYGNLIERLPPGGLLVNVSIYSSLSKQFPVKCDIKTSIEEAVRKKIILFRGSFRPGIGNHKLLCERPKSKESIASEVHKCQEILNKQPQGLKIYHPPLNRVPRRCTASDLKGVSGNEISVLGYMRVDHYKYIWGLQQYLEERARVFYEAKIPWYKQSLSVLSHLRKYEGRICVECSNICPPIND